MAVPAPTSSCPTRGGPVDPWIDRKITLRGPLDDNQRAALAGIAEKTPVTKAVRAGTEIRTTIQQI